MRRKLVQNLNVLIYLEPNDNGRNQHSEALYQVPQDVDKSCSDVDILLLLMGMTMVIFLDVVNVLIGYGSVFHQFLFVV